MSPAKFKTRQADKELGKRLRSLVALKPGAHYGNDLLTAVQRTQALRWATTLIDEARKRTT